MKQLLNPLYTVTMLCLLSFWGIACSEVAYDPVVPDAPLEVLDIKGRAGISDDDFCRYLDIENIHRTIPIVNRYIDNLPGNLDANQRAQALVVMFRSFRGITGARFLQDEYMQTPAVFFSFMDDGTDRELTLDFSSTGKVLSYYYDVTTGVYAKTERYYTIDRVFDFINSLDFEVKEITSGVCVSRLPSSEAELQRITNALNAKPYTHDGVWNTGGYLHYLTGTITIFPHLFGMNDRSYQADWLAAMREYSLVETFDYDHSGYIVEFQIPEDRTIPESHWKDMFAKYDFLEWVEMSYKRYTLADETIDGGYEEGVTAIDSKIHINLVEDYKTAPRTFRLHCATEKAYSSGSNPIIVAKELSASMIDLSFKGVAEIGMTADIGPARAYIDLGALAEGTYTLNLYNGDVKQTATLIVTAESYSIEMADNDTFGFKHKQLNRIPDNTIWGYVAYHQASTSTLVESFLNDLTGAGAVKKAYRPGYYLHFEIDESGDIVQPVPGTTGHYFDRLFVYDYQGDLANIDRLVEQYALGHESEMSIMLYTESGEEFRSWMYNR
ncbi:MAG: hypothetical protein LBV32_08400 [Tannerellaceae bacterium]|jgi:hypothetical protein|nr:hypothetical protein [Tannerellaceae bacterium]